MRSPEELFVIQLARASRRATLFLRGLGREAREDVLASAALWCWENRENYSLTTTVESWFLHAVRDAYKKWARGEIRNGAGYISDIGTADSTAASAEAVSAAKVLLGALPWSYRRVAWLDMHGYTRAEMMARGLSHDAIYETRTRLKQLRRLLPNPLEYRDVIRTTPLPSSDGPYSDDEEVEPTEREPTPWSERLGSWAHEQPARVVGGLRMFQVLQTYQSRIRDMMNKRASLELGYMPPYVPPTPWRS